MKFHVLTLFPEMVLQGLHTSILGRAAENGQISIDAVNIRDFTTNKHNRVDDYTYGGGAGMLMQAQPVYDAWSSVVNGDDAGKSAAQGEAIEEPVERKTIRTIYLTPQGKTFTQNLAEELAREEELIFLCGHYEGIDERVLEEIVTDYVSIGDYVLTGGELPAMVMIDSIARLVPGVLNNDASAETESFHGNLLEYPQYSRPVKWMDKEVPEVLLSGDHKRINAWRLEQSVKRTRERRPDLYALYQRDMACVEQLMKKKLHHIDMIELIKRGQASILYFEQDGVVLRDKGSDIFMVTARDKEAAERIFEQCREEIDIYAKKDTLLLVAHQDFVRDMASELFHMKTFLECYQAVYTRKEMLPVPRVTVPVQRLQGATDWKESAEQTQGEILLEVRPLTLEHLNTVATNYEMGDEAYVRDRIVHGCMFGAFTGEILTGFIGIHGEGSGGMLEVLPEYRRLGIGRLLESALINFQLEKGYIPYGQVSVDNEASLAVQRSLGLYFSKETVWWLEGKEE